MKTIITLGIVVLSVAYPAVSAIAQAQLVCAPLMASIEAETNPDLRSEAFERAVESIPDSDLPAMLDSLAGAVSPATDEFRELLIRRWAEGDAPAAAGWTSQFPEGPGYRAALEQVAIAWANSDLPVAVRWLNALSEGESKQAVTLVLAYEAARTAPLTALALACALPSTHERDDLLVHVVSQWAEADSTAAAPWAMSVADPNLRQRLVAAVAVASAERDGAAAALLAANALGAGEEQNRTTVSIVQRWVQNSPQAAASWVAQFPDIPPRAEAVQNLLALWTAQDAEAAGNWLRELPAGSLRDFGTAAYAQALADRDKISAMVAPAGGM